LCAGASSTGWAPAAAPTSAASARHLIACSRHCLLGRCRPGSIALKGARGQASSSRSAARRRRNPLKHPVAGVFKACGDSNMILLSDTHRMRSPRLRTSLIFLRCGGRAEAVGLICIRTDLYRGFTRSSKPLTAPRWRKKRAARAVLLVSGARRADAAILQKGRGQAGSPGPSSCAIEANQLLTLLTTRECPCVQAHMPGPRATASPLAADAVALRPVGSVDETIDASHAIPIKSPASSSARHPRRWAALCWVCFSVLAGAHAYARDYAHIHLLLPSPHRLFPQVGWPLCIVIDNDTTAVASVCRRRRPFRLWPAPANGATAAVRWANTCI
jgi:hypothetical protein